MNQQERASLLKMDKLAKSYSGKRIVSDLSFEVHRAEIIGLLGPNGAGKTTAFYMAMGLIRPDQGEIFFQEERVTHLPIHERARRGMGYLAQEPSIFRSLTVEENILAILETQNLNRSQRKEKMQQLLQELHLEKLAKEKGGSLSGGERRRLEITRALATTPSLLLLDEPFANIDPISIQEVKTLILHLKQKGISVLITDHNAREIFSLVDRIYLITGGKIFLSGTPAELQQNRAARDNYLGSDFHF